MPLARTARTALALAIALLVAGCGDDPEDAATSTDTPSSSVPATDTAPSSPATTAEPPPPETPAPAAGTVITTGDSEFGPMLFDERGQAIYLFDVETTSTPECYDECATAWPPVLTDGAPQPGGGADAALLGTTQRTDGSLQVTYAGHPLYFYVNEEPGEVLCHDVFLNGGFWYVVTPAGDPGPT